MPSPDHAVLLLSCPDRRGVVAATADFIAEHSGNIIHTEQHVDELDDVFFQRIEFALDGFAIERGHILDAFEPVRARFDMRANVHFTQDRQRMVILASRQPHCLYDLLTRWATGELSVDLRAVIANHPDHAGICEHFGIPYEFLPVTPDTKAAQQAQVLERLGHHEAQLVVLARYMQILPPSIVDAYPNQIINIHHSFLPAFIGASPYRQAYDRGVKLVGATAHYVTADLDEGPIIEQEVTRVSHRDDVASLTRKGRDLETIALSRAVRAHLEHRVLVYGRKTVVFG